MSKNQRVLYMGDTSLTGAAAYLAAVMTYHQFDFDYVDSDTPFSDSFFEQGYGLIIISDYAAKQCTAAQLKRLLEILALGDVALLMIGGWESHVGLGGDWHQTALAAVLPLQMGERDDRVNSYAPCMIHAHEACGSEIGHSIVKDLPFNTHSAAINGYNKLELKDGAELLLSLKRFSASWDGDNCVFAEASTDPLLAVTTYGAGRVASYAGDVAPHWAGGFVDWGDERHALQATGANEVEIGNWYIQFFGNIITWLLESEE